MTTGRVALTCLVIAAFALSGCCGMCKKKESDPTPTSGDDSTEPVSTSSYALKGTHFHFNRVPLEVDIPAGWSQTQNTRSWAVFRPAGGGAMAAFTAEKSCSVVEKRLYSALIELGLTNVVWSGGQKNVTVNGLSTVTAEGTAIEASQLSYVKYALTRAKGGQGCMITLVNIWKNRTGDYQATTNTMFESISVQE